MKIELHMHTSRYSACAVHPPELLLNCLTTCGYGAAFITEHNAVWPEDEISALQEQFPDIRIFPGVELSLGIDGGMHLLVLGTNDPAYLEMHDTEKVITAARDAGHLTVLAHP